MEGARANVRPLMLRLSRDRSFRVRSCARCRQRSSGLVMTFGCRHLQALVREQGIGEDLRTWSYALLTTPCRYALTWDRLN